MKILFLILIVLVFVVVVANLLMQQKNDRILFYDELKKEDEIEIDKLLNEEKEENEKFKIVDDVK